MLVTLKGILLPLLCLQPSANISILSLDSHHFVVDLVEVDLADLVDGILDLKGDESEPSVAVGLFVEHQHRVLNLE